MSANPQTFWITVSSIVVAVLLILWLSAGLLAALVVAAVADLALTCADRQSRSSRPQTEVTDQ